MNSDRGASTGPLGQPLYDGLSNGLTETFAEVLAKATPWGHQVFELRAS